MPKGDFSGAFHNVTLHKHQAMPDGNQADIALVVFFSWEYFDRLFSRGFVWVFFPFYLMAALQGSFMLAK